MNRRLVFTAFRRPAYFADVLDHWSRVRGFADWQPTAFIEPSDVADQMAEIAADAGVAVHRNTVRRGIAGNPFHALDSAFSGGADFVVLAEEDEVVSTDALEFFTWASDTFAASNVLTVCAASLAPTASPEQEHHVTLSGTFCSQLWGTWAGRWAEILRPTWDHNYSSRSPGGPSHETGWDWNIYRRCVPGFRVVHPVASRSNHIGRFDGAHTTEANFAGTQLPTYIHHRPPGEYTIVPLRDGDAPTP